MKTFLIYLVLFYLIQLLLIVFMVYIFNPVKTIGQLAEALSKIARVLWIPVLGLILGILSGILNLFAYLWPKISRIRIRK